MLTKILLDKLQKVTSFAHEQIVSLYRVNKERYYTEIKQTNIIYTFGDNDGSKAVTQLLLCFSVNCCVFVLVSFKTS